MQQIYKHVHLHVKHGMHTYVQYIRVPVQHMLVVRLVANYYQFLDDPF